MNAINDTLQEIAGREGCREAAIAQWLKDHKRDFYDALGCYPFDDRLMVLMLVKMRQYFGSFPLHKDDISRARCTVVMAAAHGEKVDDTELRFGLALLMQAYNEAVERLARLEQERWKPRPHPVPPRPIRRLMVPR